MQSRSSTAAAGRHRHLSAFSFLLLTAVGVCLGLAACGGSSSNGPSGELTGQKANEQRMVKFAKCLREHGVNAETGKGPGGKGFNLSIKASPGQGPGPGGPPPAFQAAQRACQRFRPAPPFESLSPAEKAKFAQKALEFARCMRSHGVEVPDPGSSGVLELKNIDPGSAAFEAAQKDCQHLMGKLPVAIRAGRGPGPLGGPGGNEGGNVASGPQAGGGEK